MNTHAVQTDKKIVINNLASTKQNSKSNDSVPLAENYKQKPMNYLNKAVSILAL